ASHKCTTAWRDWPNPYRSQSPHAPWPAHDSGGISDEAVAGLARRGRDGRDRGSRRDLGGIRGTKRPLKMPSTAGPGHPYKKPCAARKQTALSEPVLSQGGSVGELGIRRAQWADRIVEL